MVRAILQHPVFLYPFTETVVPVQRVTDFMAGSTGRGDNALPSSSYRLGVRSGPLHEVRSVVLQREMLAVYLNIINERRPKKILPIFCRRISAPKNTLACLVVFCILLQCCMLYVAGGSCQL